MNADLIVTMGCSAQGICFGPFFKPTIDWKLEDPKGKPLSEGIRDQIDRQVQDLLMKGVTHFETIPWIKRKRLPAIFESEKEPSKETQP
jgi:hypothetical protein